MHIPDIDIDVADRDYVLSKLKHIDASIIKDDSYEKHLVGVYFQDINVDPLANQSTIDFKQAEELGFIKLDFLHNTIYDKFKSRSIIKKLCNKEPNWDLLKNKEIVEKLPHIHDYYDLLQKWLPHSIDELAMFIALIRPGKKYLQKCKSYDVISQLIWEKEDEGYQFKKSHAYAYAKTIILELNCVK